MTDDAKITEDPPCQNASLAFILDDNLKVGEVVRKLLTMIGVAARHFVNPTQFLAELKRFQPDLIVLDLALGQSDAVEVIRELEALQYKGKILLISGRDEATLAEVEQIGRLRGLCMLQSLQKPFRPLDLKKRLNAPVAPQVSDAEAKDSSPAHGSAQLAHSLHEGLKNDWLEVWYQPKIDLKSLSVVGAEALVRMRHPEQGIIAPPAFLPSAGDPLYKPLFHYVMRRAMDDWSVCVEYGFPLKLSVNVSVSILSAQGFADVVRQMIPRHREFPGLVLEVTEDEVIRNATWVREVGIQLRLHGIDLSIDDFGSGYGSLSRLKDLSFTEVKLDRCFVSNCSSNELHRSVCQTVVDLSRRLGVAVCAEGVETADDLRCLTELGFDTAQGFLFAKPMPMKELLEFLIARNSGSKKGILDETTNNSPGVGSHPIRPAAGLRTA